MPENARSSSAVIHLCTHLHNASSVLAFQILGIFSSSTPTHFNTPFFTLTYYLSYLQLSRFNITSFYQCTALIIPILTNLLQLKYQGTDQTSSPFATHPKTMSVVVSSCAVNYLAFIAHLRFSRRRLAAVATYLCSVCSGYASVASLSSLLFTDSVRPYIYSIFALISAAEVWCCCKLVMEEEGDEGGGFRPACRRRMNRFLNNLCRLGGNPNGRRSYLLVAKLLMPP